MNKFLIVILGILPLLAACGGDDDGGAVENTAAQPQQEYLIWKCTIYRVVEGLTGAEYWSSCPNDNWNLKANQPVFTGKDACWAAIDVLKKNDAAIYDNSAEDRARGWAVKLWCFEPDNTPPAVLSVSPAEGSSIFAIEGSRLRVDFSDNMDGKTITTETFTLEDSAGTLVAGTVLYGYVQRAAVLSNDEPLEYASTYTARLSTDITDKVGNRLVEEYSWSFTTEDVPQEPADETAPVQTFELPQADSVCGLQDGIVTARFNEPVLAGTGAFTLENSSGVSIEGTVTVSNTVATFASSTTLEYNEVYTARLNGNLTDIAGNSLTPSSWSFRTELAPEGTWTPIATPANISGRAGHTAIWTGSEMIIWGGYNWEADFPWFQYVSDNGRYNPESDQWSSVTTIGAPQKREQHTATWTGNEMIIWGGVLDQCSVIGCLYATNSGGRYDPSTDTWLPMSTVGAPSPRRWHTAIWTGTELIVWGGVGNDYRYPSGSGARYNPATDTWSPLSTINAPTARGKHKAVFDGQRMIVWGGESEGALDTTDGGIYDPVADVWTAMPSQDAPGGTGLYEPASVVSSGTDMLVWLPERKYEYDPGTDEYVESYVSQARRFNFQKQQWLALPDGCNPRATPKAVWLNGRMLSWDSSIALGQSYNEQLGSWAPITPYPISRAGGASVVTAGDVVFVWGGVSGVNAANHQISDVSNLGYRLSF